MILKAEHITFYYRRKDVPVLKDISLSVSSGERVGLKAPAADEKLRCAGCWPDMNAL